ncbi:hypothetical protein BJ742DRAFT_809250 [Cladochytrium replicatum]|nr:hypothetical protein BJ742DRAFT_809250 [Cladochytrium replicatum]
MLANSHLPTPRRLDGVDGMPIGIMPSTGIVWEFSNVAQTMALNNRQACQQKLKGSLELIQDAIEEVQGQLDRSGEVDHFDDEEGDEDDDADQDSQTETMRWDDNELAQAKLAMRALKATKLIVQKLVKSLSEDSSDITNFRLPRSSALGSPPRSEKSSTTDTKLESADAALRADLDFINWLDALVTLISKCCSDVDELASAIDTPLDCGAVAQDLEVLAKTATKLATLVKEWSSPGLSNWVDKFLGQMDGLATSGAR